MNIVLRSLYPLLRGRQRVIIYPRQGTCCVADTVNSQARMSEIHSSSNASGQIDVSQVRHEKKLLRKQVKRKLAGLSEEDIAVQSEKVGRIVLENLKLLDKVSCMTLFIACPRLKEVDTGPILRRALGEDGQGEEKKVYLPRVLDSDSNMHFLRTHSGDSYDIVPPFGIHEPTEFLSNGSKREDVLHTDSRLEVIFMPGLAFTKDGRRLGRGGGYYDTFIDKYMIHAREKNWAQKPLLVALAFDQQIVDSIPVDDHDQSIDMIVTPTNVFYPGEKPVWMR
eukprot:jgi/Picsp_1/821/NSC_04310-R1_5-formyltetrahydrofolate cycloligase